MELAGTKPPQSAAKPNALMLDAALNQYFDFVATKSLATRQAYGMVFRQFLQLVGDKPVPEITREDLAAFHRFLKKEGFSDRTCANRLVNVVTFLRHFGVTGVTLKGKYTDKKVRAYRPDELKALLAAATPDEWLLFQFLLCTGCREQECMHAEKSDIDFVDKVLLIREKSKCEWKPKDYEEREIPLPDFLLKALNDRPAGLLFPAANGKLDSHMLRIVKKAAKRAGLGGTWTLHKFRKTYATVLHKDGT